MRYVVYYKNYEKGNVQRISFRDEISARSCASNLTSCTDVRLFDLWKGEFLSLSDKSK